MVLYAWLILAGPTTIVDPDSPDRSTSITPNEANRFRPPGGGRGAPPAAAHLLVKRYGLCHHGSSRADDSARGGITWSDPACDLPAYAKSAGVGETRPARAATWLEGDLGDPVPRRQLSNRSPR
jgi:hypothetical protein